LLLVQFDLFLHFLGFDRFAQFLVLLFDFLDFVRLPSLAGFDAAGFKRFAALARFGGEFELVIGEEGQAIIAIDPFLEILGKAGNVLLVVKGLT